MDELLVSYKDVKIVVRKKIILQNVNFEQKRGEFVYIIGETGSGKSSFLKTFYCDLLIADGKAYISDYNLRTIKQKQIPKLRRKVGIIFQDFQLLEDRSVYDNLRFVLKATGWKSREIMNDRIHEALDQVGMDCKVNKMPNELSSGEHQQIIIARALLNSPEIIVADDPIRNLDEKSGEKIIQLFYNIKNKGTAVVMCTHNYRLIEEYPSKIKKCENGFLFDCQISDLIK